MLSCKEVAQVASDYLEQNTPGKLNWQIRLHLLMCANCRRFMRHLRITTQVASQIAAPQEPHPNPQALLAQIKQRDQAKSRS